MFLNAVQKGIYVSALAKFEAVVGVNKKIYNIAI